MGERSHFRAHRWLAEGMGCWWGVFVLRSPRTGRKEDAPELQHASATKFSTKFKFSCHMRAEVGHHRLAVMEGKVPELPSWAGTCQERSQQQLQLRSATPEPPAAATQLLRQSPSVVLSPGTVPRGVGSEGAPRAASPCAAVTLLVCHRAQPA